MKILLLGSSGQVGWEIRRSLAPLGPVTPLTRHGKNGLSGDLADPEALAATVKSLKPDIIVNAAAYTAVDRAESEPEQARLINSYAPARLAAEANAINSLLVHYSTDYIFDGSKATPWKESDTPSPINVYGQTKLEGEEAISQSGCNHLIFRTSWVYAARGHNFIRTMLRLAAEPEGLRVINDQFGVPTSAELIADITAHTIHFIKRDNSHTGTYHLAPSGETTWWDYARLVIAEASRAGLELKVSCKDIVPVPTEEFPTPAARPRNSRLDTTRLQQTFGLYLPAWEDGVVRAVQEIIGPVGLT